MVTQTEGQKFTVSRFNANNEGVLYVRNLDSDNEGVFVKIRVGGVLTERQVDTSAVS
jgi:hypothetical protein